MSSELSRLVILNKGGGEIASAVAHKLFRAHFQVCMTEIPCPIAVSRGVAFCEAIYDEEKEVVIQQMKDDGARGKVNVQRFKGLGEMNPMQLRETSIAPDTRRLVQLQIQDGDNTNELMDMLLAKKRAPDRKAWLESTGNLAEV